MLTRRPGRRRFAAGALLVIAAMFVAPTPAAASPSATAAPGATATPAELACPTSAIDPCFDASVLTGAGRGADLGGVTLRDGGPRPAATAHGSTVPAIGAGPPVMPPRAAELAPAIPPVAPPYYSDGQCTFDGKSIPCVDGVLGYYNPSDNCYYQAMNPQPPPGDPLWGGQSSTSPAAMYNVTCELNSLSGIAGAGVSVSYRATPPLTSVTPTGNYVTALTAITAGLTVTLGILPVPAHTEPAAGANSSGLVGLPVWMWTDYNLLTWGPISFTLSPALLGLSLLQLVGASIYLLGQQVDWDMGNGTHVVCTNVGKKFTPDGPTTSPNCGYVYLAPGQFPVMATVTWYVTFNIPVLGVSGTVVVVRTSVPSVLTINELQVVTE